MSIEEIKAYKVNGLVFEYKKDAEKAEATEELKNLVDMVYYRGIDERGLVGVLIEYKEEFLKILGKL